MEQHPVLTKGTIVSGPTAIEVVWYDNPTSRDLVVRMPFTTELEDYAGMEKIFYPIPSLSLEGAPNGATPGTGDIMYYAPWGDVAIFYKDFRFAGGLVPMGKIADVPGLLLALQQQGPMVAFEADQTNSDGGRK